MQQEIEILLSPDEVANPALWKKRAAAKAGVHESEISELTLLRRSIDARARHPRFLLRLRLWLGERPEPEVLWQLPERNVNLAQPVVIAGFGPAGMFAAIRLIELGLKPVVIERGKEVRGRRRDLARINKEGVVNPESNYCFGEGGAGTFSDGKLYTRSHKRGDVARTLEIFVQHGATHDILIDAHPHIGTNKLPQIVSAMRETILRCGGEVHFDTRLTDVVLSGDEVRGVETTAGRMEARGLILATGHSGRDIFELLHRRGIAIEAKPFALGLRVEHAQALIDRAQYHCEVRHENLPAASYSLVQQVQGRGVFSFCMCPGGIICPAATQEGEVVVNGWSPSKRNSPFANSGIVTEVNAADWAAFEKQGPLAGIAFQSQIERAAFAAGGGALVAPAGRLTDFVNGKVSASLPDCSYLPGIQAADFREVLPPQILARLQEGFRSFGQKIKGYLTADAVVVGVESRTSSPVRIPRDVHTLMHPQVSGLWPCAEGAGYAGGIVSAAMDGIKCAEEAARWMPRK